jgi:hypothetical protein
MEQAVEQHYAHAVILPDDMKATVRAAVQAAIDEQFSLTDEMREQFTRQLDKLDSKESYFLDLAAEEGWPRTNCGRRSPLSVASASTSPGSLTLPPINWRPAARSS